MLLRTIGYKELKSPAQSPVSMLSSRRCSLIASYSKTTSLRSKGKWVAAARRILRLLLQLEFTVAQGRGWAASS